MGVFDHPALDEVREALETVARIPWDRVESETIMCVDIDDAAEEIVKVLLRGGYLR